MPHTLVEKVKLFLVNPPKPETKVEESALLDFKVKWGAKFGDIIDKYFVHQDEREGLAVLSPSSLGKCTRQLAYKYHEIEGEPLTYETKMTFMTGDILELVLYMLAEAVGEPVENIQKRISVGDISGTIDGTIRDVLLDVKSMSDAAFSINERNGMSDDFGYQTQLEIYKEGEQKERGAWIAINKNRGTIGVMEAPHKPYLVKLAQEKKQRVIDSSPGQLPPRDFDLEYEKKTSRLKLAMQCKFCPFKAFCWELEEEVPGWNNSITYYAKGPRNV